VVVAYKDGGNEVAYFGGEGEVQWEGVLCINDRIECFLLRGTSEGQFTYNESIQYHPYGPYINGRSHCLDLPTQYFRGHIPEGSHIHLIHIEVRGYSSYTEIYYLNDS
jgi:hypothetical protein